MKKEKMRESEHVEDRRGQQYQGGGYSGGFGGNSHLLGGLLSLLLRSKGGGKWVMLLLIGFFAVSAGTGGLDGLLNGGNPLGYQAPATQNVVTSDASDDEARFLSQVLASTEDFWTQQFAKHQMTYRPTTLVIYSEQTPTDGCGLGQSAAGPFYCPVDRKVYIDLSFYRDLTTKYRTSGDFAMAYVVAHEVGHHVQQELGTMAAYQRERRTLSEVAANQLTVRLELQADYYAGAWAKYAQEQQLLDVGDLEEALAAAHAVGDDTLQEQAYGRVVPDSFTHGTSAQRKAWFLRGYQYGDFEHGDTFSGSID